MKPAQKRKRPSNTKQHPPTPALRLLRRFWWAVLLLFVLFGLVLSFYRSNMSFQTTEYTIHSPDLPNAFSGYKIAQISDLHGQTFGSVEPGESNKLVEAIRESEADILVITGDAISRKARSTENVEKLLSQLAQLLPTYYIKGNHELWRDNAVPEEASYDAALEKMGITVLSDRSLPLYRGGARITLAGLEGSLNDYMRNVPSDPETLLGKKSENFTILLAHNPLWFSTYLKWGADLVLSGHVHGGVVRLPFIGGVFSPTRTFFPPYDRGIYTEGKQTMVVSAGMGGSGLPFRLFNPQELVLITLQSQSIH